MAKYIHWGLPQFADVWTGKAACGRVVDPDNCAAVSITCPQCLTKFRAQNPHAFAPGDTYPSIAPLKNPLNSRGSLPDAIAVALTGKRNPRCCLCGQAAFASLGGRLLCRECYQNGPLADD